jgi:cytochrome c-type biogenesis protein CcmH/NrfF
MEPVSRAEGERIPKRFSELEIIISRNQSKIMVAKEPNESYGSFTVLKPQGNNFAVVFYDLPGMYKTIADFFVETLNRQRKIPETDAKKAAMLIVKTIEKHMGFEGEFK